MDLKKFVALSVLDIKNRILPRLPHPISFFLSLLKKGCVQTAQPNFDPFQLAGFGCQNMSWLLSPEW